MINRIDDSGSTIHLESAPPSAGVIAVFWGLSAVFAAVAIGLVFTGLSRGEVLLSATAIIPAILAVLIAYAAMNRTQQELVLERRDGTLVFLTIKQGQEVKRQTVALNQVSGVFTESSEIDVESGETNPAETLVIRTRSKPKRFALVCKSGIAARARDLILAEMGQAPAPKIEDVASFGRRASFEFGQRTAR